MKTCFFQLFYEYFMFCKSVKTTFFESIGSSIANVERIAQNRPVSLQRREGKQSGEHSDVYTTTSNNPSQKYFYIYDWPTEVIDRWPKNYSHFRLSVSADFKENNGAGRAIRPSEGLYHTHQYSLFSLFYTRLQRSQYRTLDPTKASLFFIPYDLGMDSSTRQSGN